MLRVFLDARYLRIRGLSDLFGFATALVACLLKLPVEGLIITFMIYRASFFHALELKDLYIYYPE